MPANLHADRVAPGAASPNSLWRWWLAIALCSLALYAATANRGPQWQDPGHFILRVVTQQPFNPLGLALSHPLHHWLGRLAAAPGLVEPCFAVTLVSALAAAVAVANVFGCIRSLTGHRAAALLGAASLVVANTFWQMATRAECYTVSAALLSGECWCLVTYARTRRPGYLCGALCLNGLGLSNHNLALLTLPVLAVVIVRAVRTDHLRVRWAAAAGGLWVLGALIYGAMVAAEWLHSGDLSATLHSALFGRAYAGRVVSAAVSPQLVALSLGFAGFNFPNLLLPAAVYGMLRCPRVGVPSLARWALLAGLILHACFVARYNVSDQYMFFVPVYVFLAIFGGVGFAIVLGRWSGSARKVARVAAVGLLLATPVAYAVGATVARHYGALGSIVRNKPYRDDYVHVLLPWSVAERSAGRMSREAVELAGPGGLIVVEDEMARYAVEYKALRSQHSPPRIIGPRKLHTVPQAVEGHSQVVLVPRDRDAPRTEAPGGTWQRVGDLYKLTGRTHQPSPAATREGV